MTTSIAGSFAISIAGGIQRFGPIKEKGDALSENIGSVSMFIFLLFIKKLAWPIQTAKELSGNFSALLNSSLTSMAIFSGLLPLNCHFRKSLKVLLSP